MSDRYTPPSIITHRPFVIPFYSYFVATTPHDPQELQHDLAHLKTVMIRKAVTGVHFFSTPITAERIRQALGR